MERRDVGGAVDGDDQCQWLGIQGRGKGFVVWDEPHSLQIQPVGGKPVGVVHIPDLILQLPGQGVGQIGQVHRPAADLPPREKKQDLLFFHRNETHFHVLKCYLDVTKPLTQPFS